MLYNNNYCHLKNTKRFNVIDHCYDFINNIADTNFEFIINNNNSIMYGYNYNILSLMSGLNGVTYSN